MRHAEIRFEGDEVPVLERALAPEAGREIPGARIGISYQGRSLVVTIDAEDTGTLRAALNSYLRWAEVAANVAREIRS